MTMEAHRRKPAVLDGQTRQHRLFRPVLGNSLA